MHKVAADKVAGEHHVGLDEAQAEQVQELSVVKGKLSHQRFYIGEEPILAVAEKPIKSLGCWYNGTLRDKDQVENQWP
ncbi:hypothetical protein JOB18_013668 [Solea senegalensis]|uniref:Uncharacterized protein n=1 Tax=Solea senegalensis TaxID=28829 RepID=A0AAV6Q1G6_SOLSE|nr:hypothetical protein JOB18_013668 [Solea senegalensis]